MKKRYLLTLIVGSLLVFSFFFFIWSVDWKTGMVLRGFINSTFATGVIFFGLSWLIIGSNFGIFDIAVYGTKKYFLALVNRHQKMPKSYFEYHLTREKLEKHVYRYMMVVGALYLLLSIVLNLFFYY